MQRIRVRRILRDDLAKESLGVHKPPRAQALRRQIHRLLQIYKDAPAGYPPPPVIRGRVGEGVLLGQCKITLTPCSPQTRPASSPSPKTACDCPVVSDP